MSEKWTPGPWAVWDRAGSITIAGPISITSPAGVGGIVDMFPAGNIRQFEANARLMAAAPELFHALADIVARFERCCIASGSDPEYAAEACKPARAAIAKARGEP